MFSNLNHRSRLSLPSELQTVNSFFSHMRMSHKEYKKIKHFSYSMYKQFSVFKPNGKPRVIEAPNSRLMQLQNRILFLLKKIYIPRNSVHGFVIGKSVKTNAESHLGRKFVLNLDIESFFNSIKGDSISRILSSIGVNDHVAVMIAHICTKNFKLPVGSPTSPILSNMLCFGLDRRLQYFAKVNNLIYTRYADDITFSSYRPTLALFSGHVPSTGKLDIDYINPDIIHNLSIDGFKINPDKAYLSDKFSRRKVTGIVINQKLNLDRKYIRNIRATLFNINIDGYESAQAQFEATYGKHGLLHDHIRGKISWVRNIKGQSDPTFRSLVSLYNRAFPKTPIFITPSQDEIVDRSVWIIEHGEKDDKEFGQGSAFFLEDIGLVTAAHCFSKNKQNYIYHYRNTSRKFPVTIKKINDHIDLAILDCEIPTTEYFSLHKSSINVKVGDNVTAYGFPGFGPGDKVNIRSGSVNALPTKSLVKLADVSQNLASGMSGGPLLDVSKNVVGVVHKGGAFEDKDLAILIEMIYKIDN